MEKITKIIQDNIKLFFGYAFFAGIAVVVDLGILYALTTIVGIWYLYSAAISYVISVTVNFSLNKVFNFKNKSKRLFSQFSIFLTVATTGLLANQIIMYLLVENFGLWYIYAKLFALASIAGFSFYSHKNYTFKTVD